MPSATDTFLTATITHRANISDQLWTIRIDPGRRFSFAAGQYATLGVATPSRLVERAYSIVSSPHDTELEFFLELVDGGELTPLLHRLTVGDTLSLRKAAKGRFLTAPDANPTDHLCLCTVTGIAPFVSLARMLAKDFAEGRFTGNHRLFFIQGASRSSEFAYREEIERLAHEVPWLTYVPTVSRPWEDSTWRGETGRVDDIIRKYADLWSLDSDHATAYLCGHPEMIERGKAILSRRGWSKAAMREENYFVPALAG